MCVNLDKIRRSCTCELTNRGLCGKIYKKDIIEVEKNMEEKRFIHCQSIYSDGVRRFSSIGRLADGRLFTLSVNSKINRGSLFPKAPTTTLIYGRVSSDEGKTWEMSGFFYELPEREAMFDPGVFLVANDGRIHIFLPRIYNISFKSAAYCKGCIAYMRLDNEKGDGLIYKKIDCLDRYTGAVLNCIQAKSGRIIVPFSTIAGTSGSEFVSGTIYSDDGGETFYASNDVSIVSDETHIESGAVEPVVIEVGDGVILMLIRNVLGFIYYAVSYDNGATFGEAKPTGIPASNAPSVPIMMSDGRIVLFWNNALGQPMQGVRYSYARQCLHAAISYDGLKTLEGVRMIVKKRANDLDKVQNAYPWTAAKDEKTVFVRPYSIDDAEGSLAFEPAGTLLSVDAEELDAKEMANSFDEWVTDCVADENGITLAPTVQDTAYACVNFPYAKSGEITLKAEGDIPDGVRILLADCYIDRATFVMDEKEYSYKAVLGEHFAELAPCAAGKWHIVWGKDDVTFTSGEKNERYSRKDKAKGFNHMILLFKAEGEVKISDFRMKAYDTGLSTGIEY